MVTIIKFIHSKILATAIKLLRTSKQLDRFNQKF